MSDIRGLTILGEADKLCSDIRKLRHLPGMCGDDQAGLQVAWSLLQRQVPSRILHLLRAHPAHITDSTCEQIQTELQENLRYWLQYPVLHADPWKLAEQRPELPITSGDLAFPNLHRPAVVARIACLATLPDFVASEAYKVTVIDKERPELFGRLPSPHWSHPHGSRGRHPQPASGEEFCPSLQTAFAFHYTLCCNEVWAKRDALPPTVGYAWMHNLPGSEPAQVQGFQAKALGNTSWLCFSVGPATAFRLRRSRSTRLLWHTRCFMQLGPGMQQARQAT